MATILEPENWSEKKKILVILAHPDDPEFFCGGTIGRWAENGHEIEYCLFTRGEKGVQGQIVDPKELGCIREEEQKKAAAILGVFAVQFLGYEDGFLVPGLEERKTIVRIIRQTRPNIVLTCDPQNYYHRGNRLNHPDHRAAGQIVMEAVFPASGNPMFFPELSDEGLTPHSVEEIWFSSPNRGNTVIDVTGMWEKRIKALLNHRSQIPDPEKMIELQKTRRTEDSTEENPRYLDYFQRVIFA